MRVTNRLMADSITRNIQHNLNRVSRSLEQLATGKGMIRPSDKPENMSRLLSIKSSLSYLEQYDKNLDDGLSYLNLSDSSMQEMGDILQQASQMAVQGANGTYSGEDMAYLGEQADKMIDQVKDLANSSIGDRYIYAGTKNNAPPFVRSGDTIIYRGDLSGIYREVLSGDDYRIDAPGITTGFRVETVTSASGAAALVVQRQLPANLANTGVITVTRTNTGFTVTDPTGLDGVTPAPGLVTSFSVAGDVITIDGAGDQLEGLQIDMTGTAVGDQFKVIIDNKLGVFGHGTETSPGIFEVYNPAVPKDHTVDEGVFDVLFRLRDNLRAGDYAATNNSIDEIKRVLDNLLESRAGIGSRTSHFEALKDQLLDSQTKLGEAESELEDADVYNLSIAMSNEQVTLQASLASGANIMKISILDFLK